MGDNTVYLFDSSKSIISEAIHYYLGMNEWEFTNSRKSRNLIQINSPKLPPNVSNYNKIIIIADKIPEKKLSKNTLTIVVDTGHILNQNSPEYKRYSFEKGYFYPLNKTILQFLNDEVDQLEGAIVDLSRIEEQIENCIIEFENLNDSYEFLNRKNYAATKQRFVEVLKAHIHDDSENEIKYLTNRLKQARNGADMIEILIGTKEEFKVLEKNYFYNEFKKNLRENYRLYYIDKNLLKRKHRELYNKVKFGFCLYEDCIYFDYETNPNSLGYVNLDYSMILEYQEVFEQLKSISNEVKK